MADYSDIIKLHRPVLHHVHMDVGRRAKQFAPFAALKGFEECVRRKEILYVERPSLCEEKRDELDRKLRILQSGMSVTVTWFLQDPEHLWRGRMETVSGTVEFFDPSVHLRIGDTEIYVADIVELSGEAFTFLEEPA